MKIEQLLLEFKKGLKAKKYTKKAVPLVGPEAQKKKEQQKTPPKTELQRHKNLTAQKPASKSSPMGESTEFELVEKNPRSFNDDDFYAFDPETKLIKDTWSHKSVGRRHSEYVAQREGWKVVSGMSAKHLGLLVKKRIEGVAEGRKKPVNNFDIEDIKNLEKVKDLETLKILAFKLISTPSEKPMKPEKVEWFKQALINMDSRIKVIKLMYDLLLSGEGHSVIGSRNSTNPNSYRQRFNEQDVDETFSLKSPDGDELDKAVSAQYNTPQMKAKNQKLDKAFASGNQADFDRLGVISPQQIEKDYQAMLAKEKEQDAALMRNPQLTPNTKIKETQRLSTREKFKRSLKRAGYDPDAGAKRIEDLLAKQKKEREEREKQEQETDMKEAKQPEAPKPRNFVAKNAKTAGAGAHKDAKKASKEVRGQKHKNKELAEGEFGDMSSDEMIPPQYDMDPEELKAIRNAEFTDEEKLQAMIKMSANGVRDEEIAQLFDMDPEMVARILDDNIEDIEASMEPEDDVKEAEMGKVIDYKPGQTATIDTGPGMTTILDLKKNPTSLTKDPATGKLKLMSTPQTTAQPSATTQATVKPGDQVEIGKTTEDLLRLAGLK